MSTLPPDYPHHRLMHCVELAAKASATTDVEALLPHVRPTHALQGQLQETLYCAAYSRNPISVVGLLLERFQVDVNYRVRDYGHTMLFLAAESGDLTFARWLLDQGADRAISLPNGDIALTRAKTDAMRQLLLGNP